MVKMICVLHQVLREVIQWQGHEKVAVSKQRQEAGESCSSAIEIGHDEIQKKERSFIRTNDNESEKDEASRSSESDSESEEGKYDEGLDDDLKELYKQVCGTLVKLGKKNMVLVNEQRRLEALIEVLQKDLQPVVKMYARTTSYGKTAVNTATATRTASSSATRKIPENEDEMVKMICVLHQVLWEVIQWQGREKVSVSKQGQEDGEPCGNKEVQCYKYRGYGHFKRECPMAKRRRFKGFRWRKIEHDSESEKGKYDEGQDDDLKECYKQVCGTLLKLGKENMVLVKEQRRLEALIEVLQKDLQVEKEETKQVCVKPDETQKGKTESVFMSAMKPVFKMYAKTTSYGKTAVKTATATRTASSSATKKIPEAKVFQAIGGEATY
ncbi:hypothetical protein F2Q70_00015489 [Brassica cretica]|uniref:CCHC-type domain-containing protein n=1 Tax=Brassica cretica TaxID=69181 RepID=A0A8S9HYI3_BRACR|nr:hypothetical protein F2Q70_00015489 [Brassica cretica]